MENKEIKIFDSCMDYIDTIDNYSSLQWTRKFHEPGIFEIHCPLTSLNKETFKKGNLIWKNDSKEVGKIEHIDLQLDDNGVEFLMATGRFSTSILDRRILMVTEQYTNKEVELIMRNMVDRNCISTTSDRKISNLNLGELNNFIEKTDYQKTYAEVLPELNTLSLTSGIGFYIRTDLPNKQLYFETIKGRNRTLESDYPVVFGRENDNIKSQTYIDSDNNYKNVAIVAGEGEGTARKIVIVGTTTGENRRELYVDARDLQRKYKDSQGVEHTLTEEEYVKVLTKRGEEKLAECREIKTLEGKIINNNYIYKEDWDLGDMVTILDKRWGVKVNTRITEVLEIYENGSEKIVPTFGDKVPTVLDKIKQKLNR